MKQLNHRIYPNNIAYQCKKKQFHKRHLGNMLYDSKSKLLWEIQIYI